ncbi:MAG: hypothetical protein MUC36_10145 [Planctomycetes bacterium]|jgi:hypothetical protein|nr:hypothetical protein [Planctomycetota bacterium]
MRSLRPALLLLLPALAGSAAVPTARVDTPILEFVRDNAAATGDAAAMTAAAKALDAAIARCDGHGATWRAAAIDGDGITLRATQWNSIEAAEAAALQLDGDATAKAFAATTTAEQQLRAHFRQLRTQTYQDAPCGHLEVVVFRTRPGVTREANLQKFDAAEADFAQGKGLLGHSLWLAPDGSWVHLLNWASADDYAQTGKALFSKPGVGGWIRSLDFQRFVVHRGDVVR